MKYFKNTELAKLYNVSEKSVRNWIESAQAGKLDLQLYEHSGKWFIANTAKNSSQVEKLAEKGKKFRNSRGFKAVTPISDFYDQFTAEEIFELITSLDVHREIPHKYAYFAEGAKVWDAYSRKMADEQFPNSITNTTELVRLSTSYLDSLLEGYSGVNIVDIGVGNAAPVKPLLEHLINRGLMRRYIAIDASSDILDIAERNVKKWFGNKISFERALQDANYDRFDNMLVGDTFSENEERIVNIVLLIGGTIANLMDPGLALRTIYGSLSKDDVFIISRKLDTPESRRFFDFSGVAKNGHLVDKEKFILDMIGVNESMYDVEQLFDSKHARRVIQARLKVDLAITFRLGTKHRVIELNKDDAVVLWHANHNTLTETIDQLDDSGFEILQAMRSIDRQYFQVISKIKTL